VIIGAPESLDAVVEIDKGKSAICWEIMKDLPEWFDDRQTAWACAQAVAEWPMFGHLREGAVIGFVSVKPHPPSAAEIYALGVRPRFHRRGIGRGLVLRAESFARHQGMRLLTVKTLAPLDPDPPHYEATRRFYAANGFLQAEVFEDFWDDAHPCLLLIKPL